MASMAEIDNELLNRTFQLAVAHHRAGRLAEAERLYREILSVRIEPHTLNLLGLIARSARETEAARQLLAQAIALKPEVAEFHNNLGNVLRDLARADEAAACFEQAIALDPVTVAIQVNYGAALLDLKQTERACTVLETAAEAEPDFFDAQFCLGLARRAAKDYSGAVVALRRAVALAPDRPDVWYSLGNALHLDELDGDASACFERAIALDPGHAESYCNMGMTKRNSVEAVAWYERAIALKPELSMAHSNLAHTLLLRGEYLRGFHEYEWRWHHLDTPPRPFRQPEWNGEAMADELLLVHAEQGFGDTAQFVRYLPLVRERVRRIVFECQPELLRLLRLLPGLEDIVARGDALPAFDRHVPLMTLPRIFGTTLETVPASVPYLAVPPDVREIWRQRLAAHGAGKRVGLVWAGNPKHQNDLNRSMRLAELAPLFRHDGVTFFALQKGPAADEGAAPPVGAPFVALSPDIEDFADSAAIIDSLDLLISVDTSVVHLAGALARPVWAMLPIAPDWRWQLERRDSVWYPTLTLFRQKGRRMREALIEEVGEALGQWLEKA
jgi:tetratricopeptide (TPR) repeat protein